MLPVFFFSPMVAGRWQAVWLAGGSSKATQDEQRGREIVGLEVAGAERQPSFRRRSLHSAEVSVASTAALHVHQARCVTPDASTFPSCENTRWQTPKQTRDFFCHSALTQISLRFILSTTITLFAQARLLPHTKPKEQTPFWVICCVLLGPASPIYRVNRFLSLQCE